MNHLLEVNCALSSGQHTKGGEFSSVVEHLSTNRKVPGSIPGTRDMEILN